MAYCLVTQQEEFTDLLEPPYGEFRGDAAALKKLGSKGKFLFQIAVDTKSGRKGIGSRLLRKVFAAEKVPLILNTLTKPVNNQASAAFFKKNGFQEIGMMYLPEYRDFGKLEAKVFLYIP